MKRIRNITLSIFLAAVFILPISINNLFAGRAEFEEIKKIEEAQKPLPQETISRPKVEYRAEGLPDPFVQPMQQESAAGEVRGGGEFRPPSLTVQGIIWGGILPQAIINNKVVKVKDVIEGASVISINKDGVAVMYEGKQFILPSPAITGSPKKPQGG